MEQSKLDRINELAHIAKERSLSQSETKERDALRKEYIQEWRNSTISVLENTYIVDKNGFKHKLEKKDGSR